MELSSLPDKYKSKVVSKGTLDIDELLFDCIRFLQSHPRSAVLDEVIAVLEGRLKNAAYHSREKRHIRKKELLLSFVFPLLESLSPPGHFFGPHPGDPGRIGYWSDRFQFRPDPVM